MLGTQTLHATGRRLVLDGADDVVMASFGDGAASQGDVNEAFNWAERRRKTKPPVDGYTLRLLTADRPPESPREWERWWLLVTRKAIAADYLVYHGRPDPVDGDHTRLVHASCRNELHVRQRRSTALQA